MPTRTKNRPRPTPTTTKPTKKRRDIDINAEQNFVDEVHRQGGQLAPGAIYVSNRKPVEAICVKGHTCWPTPAHVTRGLGICGQCRVTFDRVYLLVHKRAHAVKIGIASKGWRVNLHRRRGYEVLAEWRGLDHTDAKHAERSVLNFWRNVKGCWYVEAAPLDGRTETAPLEYAGETYRFVTELLGPPEIYQHHDIYQSAVASLPVLVA